MLFRFLLIVPFAGSVFITSGKFVDATNTPKVYFVLVFLLAMVITLMVRPKQFKLTGVFDNKALFSGIFMVCFVQAFYGLFQFVGWLPSNHSEFAITGSFDNPAGFAAILSLGFPISMFLLIKSKGVERYLAATGLMVILIAVLLSGSRAGVLAIIISSVVFLLFQTNIASKLQQLRFYKLLAIFIMVCVAAGVFILYNQKKDSANGRLLIWKVSAEMIKEKPILGHGYGMFQAKYMDYQAEYFKNNPNSKFELLADNVKHPFNEFIKIAVEFGMIGLTIILLLILFIFGKIIKSKNGDRELVLSGLASFLVFACFSYPLQYIAIWLLLAFYFSVLLPSKKIEIKNATISIITRSVVVLACTFSIVHTFRLINAEIKWKTIAVSSLRGKTEKMLPEYEKLYSTSLKHNPFFLYNYGAELNVAGKFDQSINILTECEKRFSDYDLQMLLADNCYKKGESGKAIQTYQHASNMIPCRFLPIYQIFEIYRKAGQKNMAIRYANTIVNKNVKIPSGTVSCIKNEAKVFLNERKL